MLRVRGHGDVCMYVCMYLVRQLEASAGESPPGRTVSHPATPARRSQLPPSATSGSVLPLHQPLSRTTPLSATTTTVLDLI